MLKSLGLLFATMAAPLRRWNVRFAVLLVLGFFVMVGVYAVLFHELMALEGRRFSWVTSLYWTFVTMSTLGFGDIVFESDLGRLFSVVVLLTGSVFILVLLPFLFIQFVFTPWMRERDSARAPRRAPDGIDGHVVLSGVDPISDALIERAKAAGVPYLLLVEEADEALRLFDRGYRVMVGARDEPETYRHARVDRAALVALTMGDEANTNVAFTVREIDEDVPIAALASRAASVDVLELAGCHEVVELAEVLGRAMARRVVGTDARAHVIGEFGNLRIAEASVRGTELVGRTVREAELRQRVHVNVVGIWEDGRFAAAAADSRLTERTVLILAGSEEQLAAYDRAFGVDQSQQATPVQRRPVLILGGGRVGRAAARALAETGVDATIVEKRPERIRPEFTSVEGDAAALEVLEEAGVTDAAAVLVTTHEDDVNVYLTLYLRRLRPDVQLIARATRDRNVSTLHRAGADAVLSYASIGATALWNAMGRNRRLVVAEGLEMFRVPMPRKVRGQSLSQCEIGARSGCHVVAIAQGDHLDPNPDPEAPLPAHGDLVLIGDEGSEERFVAEFGDVRRRHR
ncbi:TrkA family potassium uptake protein [Egicoccus sp. AB-alg6-2]|uniref:potassium channel family protein n=1 Tax=Egicoccus sp. AB-alg6-2 TaxID=3242692 RepID=UPI00359D07E5